ncbi:hypothetical protein BOTBODRAFT_118510 [Botryobasidium botryosum FD-172 SS1]|uniref:Uncharacterized protein n=1 Tax=Botryobasidium botryosum (strain FD-172 SS1) TaxID=930990 RepID=A0A067LZ30_BOTB1|nr:hypothetical protein BOTBODRAFT_118510 [Botryobasidium botryosum FD-172 SS1]
MPEGPTAQEIWAEDVVKVAFQTAWNDSFPNRQTCREEGGWIYAGRFFSFHVSINVGGRSVAPSDSFSFPKQAMG